MASRLLDILFTVGCLLFICGMINSLTSPVCRSLLRFSRLNTIKTAKSHVQPIRFPRVTYNDMTKPEGPWQEKYDAMNAEYSKYMYLGIFSFVLTFGLTLYTLDLFKYTDPPHKNTPEGLAFLNPNPDVLADIQK